VKVAGKWRYVYRAVDQYGQIIDVYVSRRRDFRAARFPGGLPTLGVVRKCDLVGEVVDRCVGEDRHSPLERGDGGGDHSVSPVDQSHPMIAAARSRLRTPSTPVAATVAVVRRCDEDVAIFVWGGP
jgi:hypothetical protein